MKPKELRVEQIGKLYFPNEVASFLLSYHLIIKLYIYSHQYIMPKMNKKILIINNIQLILQTV